MRSWAAPPAHVHHMTFDLAEFLEGIGLPARPGSDPSREPLNGNSNVGGEGSDPA